MRTHIDLFSGIGGFALAARWCGFKTVAFCERDEYCQRVLAKNFGAYVAVVADATSEQDNGKWRNCERGWNRMGRDEQAAQRNNGEAHNNGVDGCSTPIIPDIFNFRGDAFDPAFILTGGFPCQPFSHAGKRRGTADDRAIWPEMYRVITENRPTWVIGENVAGLISMELDRVLADLENAGYAAWTLVIPACAVDAKHRRDRCWIVAYGDGGGHLQRQPEIQPAEAREYAQRELVGCGEDLAHAEECGGWPGLCQDGQECDGDILADGGATAGDYQSGLQGQVTEGKRGGEPGLPGECCRWEPEPDVGRVAHGVSHRVDRLKGLGNAIVPQAAYEIMRAIYEVSK